MRSSNLSFIGALLPLYTVSISPGATTAMAKYWLTDCEGRIVDRCVQLHGGVGYMNENPVARLWADSRVHRIYGGANEIMKEIIGQSL